MGPSSGQVHPGTPPDIRSQRRSLRIVVQHDPVVRRRHFDAAATRREALQSPQEIPGLGREIPPHLDQRDDLPVSRQAGIESAEGVGNPAPLLDRRRERVPAIDEVPHQGPDDPDLRHPSPSAQEIPARRHRRRRS